MRQRCRRDFNGRTGKYKDDLHQHNITPCSFCHFSGVLKEEVTTARKCTASHLDSAANFNSTDRGFDLFVSCTDLYVNRTEEQQRSGLRVSDYVVSEGMRVLPTVHTGCAWNTYLSAAPLFIADNEKRFAFDRECNFTVGRVLHVTRALKSDGVMADALCVGIVNLCGYTKNARNFLFE